MQWLRRYPEMIGLTVAAVITRFWTLFNPGSVVFDEVYFKIYAGDYLTGSYYFDPHPPLGKLLLGAVAWLTHQDPSIVTSATDGAPLLRVLPAIAGAALIPLFYVLLRQLGASKRVATLGGILLLLENALLVESRFILIDSMLLLFGLGSLSAYLASRHRRGPSRWGFITLAAFAAGCALSTKWTGVSALGLIGVIWIADVWRARGHNVKEYLLRLALIILIPIGVYLSVFAVHFSLLTKTGQGDAFMSQKFQQTLKDSPTYDPSVRMSFWEKFADLNNAMHVSEQTLKTATHPYGSKWYTWPLMIRPIYYWQGDTLANGTQGNIYLLGNPVIWWGVPVVILSVLLIGVRAARRLSRFLPALGLLGVAYFANFLPFSQIVRVMFLYHYFFALIFSLAAALLMLGAMADWTDDKHPWRFSSKLSRNLYFGIITTAVIAFIYFAPLSYGTPLSTGEQTARQWLSTWR